LKAKFDINLKHFYRFRNVLAIVRQDHSISLWDLETRKSVALLAGHSKWVTTLSQGDLDHKLLFSASADKLAMAWDIARYASNDVAFLNPYAIKGRVLGRRTKSSKKASKRSRQKPPKGGMVGAAAAAAAASSSAAGVGGTGSMAGSASESSARSGGGDESSSLDDSSFDSTTDQSESSMGEWIDSAAESAKSLGVPISPGVTFKGHSDVVTALAVTDVDAIFTASADKSIKRWTKLGKCIETLTGHTGMVTHMHIYGGTLVSVARDQTMRTWDVSSTVNPSGGGGKGKGKLKLGKKKKTKSSVIDLDCAATRLDAFDSLLMLPSSDNSIRSFNMANWKRLGTCSGHTAKVTSIACNNVNYFWSAGEDRQIMKWASISGKLLCVYVGHKGPVHQLHIANSALYSSSADGTIRVWSQRLNKESWFFGDIGPETDNERQKRKDGLAWYTGGTEATTEREAQAQEEKYANELSWYM
jgi:WD40 repeat protein